MNKCNRSGSLSLMIEAVAFIDRLHSGDLVGEKLRPSERSAIAAFCYFAASRAGETCDTIPISFGMVFPPPPRVTKWWEGHVPAPIPFRQGEPVQRKLKEEPEELRQLDENMARYVLSLSVLQVADRFRKAS